jgi:hypothetical protein
MWFSTRFLDRAITVEERSAHRSLSPLRQRTAVDAPWFLIIVSRSTSKGHKLKCVFHQEINEPMASTSTASHRRLRPDQKDVLRQSIGSRPCE